MIDLEKIRAIDIHTHAEEPCGCHEDDGYDDLQSTMASYFGAPWKHPPTIPETAAHYRAANIAAVIFPASPVVGGNGACTDAALLADIRDRLAPLAANATGSSTRVGRALVLSEPPSLIEQEMTARGNLNLRKVLTRRADLVERLYTETPDAAVVRL